MTDKKHININVPVLARVEGEGALELELRGGDIEKLHLRIYEPPRFFEKLLVGRSYTEIADIVARICGICPVAYQITAVQAIEQAFEVNVDDNVRQLRRLLYCGEWIQSHALHIHLLAAPDYFGCASVIELAKRLPNEVTRGIKIQHFGNRIIQLFGGRSIHPVGVKAGGFYRIPTQAEFDALRREVTELLPEAEALVRWVAGFQLPVEHQEFNFVALNAMAEYPITQGDIINSNGLRLGIDQFQEHFQQLQVNYSNALHVLCENHSYLVGPLARLNHHSALLHEQVKSVLESLGVAFPIYNMFYSALARAVEIYQTMIEVQRLLAEVKPVQNSLTVHPRPAVGYGCTEAPRGLLWHRYEFDEKGNILNAAIVAPTSQNQARIEEDIYNSISGFAADQDDKSVRQRAEMIIRNYDPCISCATHFLRVKIQRH